MSTNRRETLTTSQLIQTLQQCLKQYGDRPVYFSDGYDRHGASCHAASAANFDSPTAVLIKAFSLETGIDSDQRLA